MLSTINGDFTTGTGHFGLDGQAERSSVNGTLTQSTVSGSLLTEIGTLTIDLRFTQNRISNKILVLFDLLSF